MESFGKLMKTLGLARIVVISSLLLGTASFLYYVVDRLNRPEMALLYSDLDLGDAGRIVANLEDRNIDVRIDGGGTQVLVPIDMVARLRMDLAESGLPAGGSSIGYEIFDKSESFGTTAFVQNINHLRALEGELSRTIRTIGNIGSARVHLVLPKREAFQRHPQPPSASVVVRMQGAIRLDENRVQAIQHLVASAVPMLQPDQVSIIDDRGNLLSRADGDSVSALMRSSDEIKRRYQSRLVRSIESLIEQVVGPGKVRAEVTVDLDFDRIKENSELFDPSAQVARSSQTMTEKKVSQNPGGAAEGAENVPEGGQNANTRNRNEETINYEISKTTRSFMKETGGVKRLSVAVLVDGVYAEDKTYQERTEAEIRKIQKMIKSAIGFDDKRGDQLEIVNMRFAPIAEMQDVTSDHLIWGLERHHLIRLLEIFILAAMGILALIFVIKPLIHRVLDILGKGALSEAGSQDSQGANPSPQKTASSSSGPTPPGQKDPHPPRSVSSSPQQTNEQEQESEPEFEYVDEPAQSKSPKIQVQKVSSNNEPSKLDQMIQLKMVEGKVRHSSLNRITKVINENIDETVAILREWMDGNENGK